MIPGHSEELSLALDDWGVTITHISVIQVFDPETQSVAETTDSIELQAIAGPVDATHLLKVPGQQQYHTRSFLVRRRDWPGIAIGASRRLAMDDATYDVMETTSSTSAGWLLVTGVRRA